jgi:pimeloyl-ACP methyl ester carboxylesterase
VTVAQHGSGSPALVLIPGITDSGSVWDTTVARYAGAHTIYVLTLPGFGGSASIAPPAQAKVCSTVSVWTSLLIAGDAYWPNSASELAGVSAGWDVPEHPLNVKKTNVTITHRILDFMLAPEVLRYLASVTVRAGNHRPLPAWLSAL